MSQQTSLKGIQTGKGSENAGGEDRRDAHRRNIIEIILFVIGLIVLLSAATYIHFHKRPLPQDISFTQWAQGTHLPSIVDVLIRLSSAINDPIPSIVALIVLGVGMCLLRWFQQGIFLVATVMVSDGMEFFVNTFAGRPRPTPAYHIKVDSTIPFTSFPSGHTEHDVAFYGFLLYLSFSKAVRQWRYRWVLIPFQILAVLDILTIGYSRVLEGEHWLTDVLAGYLSGAVWLLLMIFVYRWATAELARRKARGQGFHFGKAKPA